MKQSVRQQSLDCIIALAVMTAALLIRWPLDSVLEGRRPYLTLFGGVALAIWATRWKPATLAAVVGFLAANYFIAAPENVFDINRFFVAEFGVYILSAGLIIFSGESWHRAQDRIEHEVAERKKAEESERRQKDLLRVTLASIGDAVMTTDIAGRITYLNAVAEYVTGWMQDDAEGQPLETVFHIVNEQTGNTVESPAMRALQEGVVVGLANHTVLITKDGTERPIDDSAAPIRDADGQILGCVLVFRDITQRRRAEQERTDDEARIRSVVNYVLDGIITIDEQGTVDAFNPAAEKLFGYLAEEVIGQNVRMLMPEPFHGEHDSYLANYRNTGDAKVIGIGREVVGRRKDGVSFPMDLAVSEFWLSKRRYFTGIVRDITERKRIEKEMYDLLIELKDGDRRKDEFLAMLAHELRGPLAPLRNMLEIMKRAAGDGDILQQARSTMERQLSQLVRLVDDLIDVSRITRNKLELRKERVELASVIEQAVETCRPLAESNEHEVTVTLPPKSIQLNGDPVRLSQIFSNLINNACKYTEPGGRVWLTTDRQGSDVLISVKDNGTGIPPEMLPRIFEMFTQADRTLERSQGGLGIGLTLVKQLVEMHDGTVEALSDGPGLGSEFVVRLPIFVELHDAKRTPIPTSAVQSTPPRRVLVVDDNRDSAASLALLLKITGNETLVACDGLEAIEAAEQFHPDMVLLDIGLPKMNGFDACRHIREQAWGKNMVLVALTGWGQEEDRIKSKDAGFDHHLIKPVEFDTLMRMLGELRPTPT